MPKRKDWHKGEFQVIMPSASLPVFFLMSYKLKVLRHCKERSNPAFLIRLLIKPA
jgi:hypothetical protein